MGAVGMSMASAYAVVVILEVATFRGGGRVALLQADDAGGGLEPPQRPEPERKPAKREVPEPAPATGPGEAGGLSALRRRFRRGPSEPQELPREPEPAPHVRVLGREVAPSPEAVAVRPAAEAVEAAPPAPPRVEAEPAPPPRPRPPEPVSPPPPAPAPPLQSVPAPPPAPAPEPEPAPLEPAAQQVIQMPVRGGPREWNLWDLERLVREHAGRDVMVDEERSYLLMYLREFANADGVLPVDFDALVRESFGDLVGAPN